MNRFSSFIEERIAPLANNLARQKYVQAIQSTFLTMIPFMTVGSFALILISPAMDYKAMDAGFMRSFFEAWQAFANFSNGPLNAIFTGTMGCLALYVAVGIAYYLSKHYKMSTFLPTALCAASFIVVNAVSPKGELTMEYFGGTGLFAAMFTSIVTLELYRFLYNKKVGRIELSGAGVPPVLTESFASLVPVLIVMLVMGMFSSLVIMLTGGAFPGLMGVLMAPIVSMVDNVWGVILLSLLVMILWWFGIHDSVITGPLSPFLYNNLAGNMAAYAAGTAAISLPYILTEPFWWTFMAIGGSGATFGLALLLIRSKSKQMKTVGKLAIVPAFFNINEPIIFGVPLMLNPTLMFPFIFAMTANGVISYLMMDLQFVARTFVYPSWNMFCPIGALLATMDIKAVLLVVGLIVMDILIYYPFFKVYEKQKIKEEQAESDSIELESI
ncbi:MAG: PTS transporter subunit EIIC [Erysipelotrichaceae bacterium]